MDSSVMDEFFIEAEELLTDAEDALLALERGESSEVVYNKVYRNFHSLKGASGMMGLTYLQKHMHLTEDTFESYKTKPNDLQSNIDYFLSSLDAARSILKGDLVDFNYQISGATNKKDHKKGILISQNEKLKTKFDQVLTHTEDAAAFIGLGKVFVIDEDSIAVLNDKKFQSELFILLCSSKPEGIDHEYCSFVVETTDAATLNDVIESRLKCSEMKDAFNKTVQLLLYQYSDLDKYLKDKGKETVRKAIKEQILEVLDTKKRLVGI